jgi:hypothetical protein
LCANGIDWPHGIGEEITGLGEALLRAITGCRK